MYVPAASAIFAVPLRSGVVKGSHMNTANGTHSQRNHGRLCPYFYFVWSTMNPQTGASMASRRRVTRSSVPVTATESPKTSV